MGVAQRVNYYETLTQDNTNMPLFRSEMSMNPVKVQFHPAELSRWNSEQAGNITPPQIEATEIETFGFDPSLLLDESDIFCSCPEPLPETQATAIPIISTARAVSIISNSNKPTSVPTISTAEPETSNPEPSSPIQEASADSDTETIGTRRRSSSGEDSKESCNNSSSSSLPCLSRSSSMTSGSSPVTPKRDIPTFTLTTADELDEPQPYDLDLGLPCQAIDEDLSFSTPIIPQEPKGKEREISTEQLPTFTKTAPKLDDSTPPPIAAQLHAGFRYSLVDRQFHSQISLGYMPTIHENFQALPFLNEDPNPGSSRRRSLSAGGLPKPTGLMVPPQHQAVVRPKVAESRPESIKSNDSTSTTKTAKSSKSIKKMPSSLVKGFRNYYCPKVS